MSHIDFKESPCPMSQREKNMSLVSLKISLLLCTMYCILSDSLILICDLLQLDTRSKTYSRPTREIILTK